MTLSWKSFDFFDVSQVTLADDETRHYLEGNELSCVCAGSNSLFLGSSDGYVRIFGPSWKVVQSFRAHDVAIAHMRQLENTSLLVTVADNLSEPELKVWALDKLVKKTNIPTCLSSLRINNTQKHFPVTTIAMLDDLSQIAVGFANGSVTLARGDLINDLGTRQRVVFESKEPIMGLEISTDGRATNLLVATTSRLLHLSVPKRGQTSPPRTIEDAGCAIGCMAMDYRNDNIIVARDDALYYYAPTGSRGPPHGYQAEKRSLHVWGDYVVLVCGMADSGVVTSFPHEQANAYNIVILEPELRVAGHSEVLRSPVKAIVQIQGDLIVILYDGRVCRYHEKPLQQRLEMLYLRNMYPLAIELAQKSGLDAGQRSLIYRRFGDHLYQKADYDGAMLQYIRAIDATEPSQVIRKFLDTQRIHNLIQYLEQLHERRRATADHTTLLLNCYAKLKDMDKLERFIRSPGELRFDLDTAISMCRQGGYYEQAAYLARRHGEADLVVDILIEDSKQYDEALDFIWRQDPETAYSSLCKYARVLIEHCPSSATQLLMQYYTGQFRPRRQSATDTLAISPTPPQQGMAAGAASAVQNLTHLLPLPYLNTLTVQTPPIPGSSKAASGQSSLGTTETAMVAVADIDDTPAPVYAPPPPRTAFSFFIDHPDQFVVFLETCLKQDGLTESDKSDLYTALFEMYLYKANEKKSNEQDREEWEKKAKALVAGEGIPMESYNVLLLSHLSQFKAGTELIKEQSGLILDIFRSYTSAKDTRGAMRTLRKYGQEEPQLYLAALAYLTSDARALDEAGPEELSRVLDKIDSDKLMAPLQVVQTLARHDGEVEGTPGVATVGMIKPYLLRTIERERRDIAANRKLMSAYRNETEEIQAELADLSTKPVVFQAIRCADCGQSLDLPTVHFLCKHSFHERCLKGRGDGGGSGDDSGSKVDCPQCRTRNDAIRLYRRQQLETREKHDVFKADLERSADRFATVADWIGRGVI